MFPEFPDDILDLFNVVFTVVGTSFHHGENMLCMIKQT